MCKAFSIIASKSKVYWKTGLDSHEEIKNYYKLKDDKIDGLIGIEITPDKGYLYPEKTWTLRFDNTLTKAPDWWKVSHENMVWEAFKEWKKQVYAGFNYLEARNPINPLKLPEVKRITKKHKLLLKAWGSVWGSVWDSVGGSVWDSVECSVRGSVWGYVSSLFPNIKFKFDFSSNTKLWKMGLVPSFDGTTWRLHTGKKAKIVFEINKKDLKKL